MFQERKRRDGFLFTSVFFNRFLGSSIFPFVLFLSVAIRFYIHIYIFIYVCMYVCSADYLYDAPLAQMNHQRILDL